MRSHACQVHLWVTKSQHAYMKSKAKSYGITLTRLVLLAVEAYTRTYEGDPEEGALVAVNYGVWNRVDDDLARTSDGLRLAVRQLNGMRRALVGHGNTVGLGTDERQHTLDIIESCRSELRGMHDDVTRCTAILYLTKKERALAADYVNFGRRNGKPVWQQMDETRHALRCDVPAQGHKNVRTYEHFVLSPDPRDEVDLPTLRELACAWAREYFGSYQVAIYYHDDNERRIPHAHLIVNNANLDRPGRVSTMLTPAFEARIFKGLQRMAAERGLHAFIERPTSVNNAEWAKVERERNARELPKGTVQRTYRSKRDRELEAKGISWKRDVRDRMECALRMSKNEDEFLEACRALGLGVGEASGKRNAGERVYTHPAADTWRVMGKTLGRDWSTWSIQRRLAQDRQRKVPKPEGDSRKRLLSAMATLSTAEGEMALQVIGTTRGVPVTASVVTDMLAVCGELDVRSTDDFKEAIREPMRPEDRTRLRDAMRLARALGYLPSKRDRVDGQRVPRTQGNAGQHGHEPVAEDDHARQLDAQPIPQEDAVALHTRPDAELNR